MPAFNNFDDLIKKVKDEAMKVLQKEVAEKVVEKAIEHAQHDVYDVYTPVAHGYRRKYTLIKKSNYKKLVTEDSIIIKSVSTHDEKDITEVVETGKNYDYRFKYYDVPRPFIENTKKEIEEKDLHIKAMKDGLKKKGFDVK